MKELFDASFSAINLFPTILLLLSLIYWIIVILGIFDMDTVDLDLDTDIDVDVDADTNIDVDSNVGIGGSVMWINSVLSFFNIGRVPVIIIFSIFSLSLWMISVMVNYTLGNHYFLVSLLLLLPNIFVSMLIAKFITMPLVKIFKKAKEIENNTGLEGKICTITLPASNNSMGQAIIKINGDTFNINIITPVGISMEVGDQGLVIEYQIDKKMYLVEPYN
ncbi:MAG: DUF1449 family protein [Bacteroidales bacterium]|nr:DUF1449 family protein [Bacteroidales bacterium]MCF8458419.1 DUF1449 family protein [Bacteroidales bacterium]